MQSVSFLCGLNQEGDSANGTCGGGLYRAAAANWFLRLGELGSVERALAANSSLLEDMEMVFRLVTTCV